MTWTMIALCALAILALTSYGLVAYRNHRRRIEQSGIRETLDEVSKRQRELRMEGRMVDASLLGRIANKLKDIVGGKR